MTEKATDGDSDDQQHELRSSHGLCGAPASRKGSSPFLKLGLTNLGKDTASSSWLSLNSSAPGNPICTKSKNSEDSISEGPAAKIMASRPIRSICFEAYEVKRKKGFQKGLNSEHWQSSSNLNLKHISCFDHLSGNKSRIISINY